MARRPVGTASFVAIAYLLPSKTAVIRVKVQACDDSSFSMPVMAAIPRGRGPLQGQQAAPAFPHSVRRTRATEGGMAP
jgi:hypothetical protein